jgi:hypothetical protein
MADGRVTAKPHPEWRLLVAALSTREYGALVTHDEVMQLTGLRYPSPRYFAQMSKARKALLKDWEREVESAPRLGYRLVLPGEFHRRSRRELGFAGRRLRLSAQILVAAPQALLSSEQNMRNANALAKIGGLELQRRKVSHATRPSAELPARHDVPKMNAR